MLVFHNNLTLCTSIKAIYIYIHIVQCPLLNCSILVKAVVVVLMVVVMVVAVVMVCSLSSFPRPQPQCSPYKTSPRVCAYEKHRTACAVQCMCSVCARAKDCVCAMAAVASLLVLSSTCRPNSTCRHCTIRWWGWGLMCPAKDLLQDQTRAKQGHKKKWLFLQRFLPRVDLASGGTVLF